MAFTKITAEDTADKGVVGLADTPNLSTQDMQQKFDEIANDVIIPKFNNLCDELDAEDMEHIPHSEDITDFKLDSDGKLQVSTDNGKKWKAAGSSGHLLVDGSGTEYPARSRMQFSNNVVLYDYDIEDGNKTVVSIPSGEKGERGESATIRIGDVSSGTTPSVENVGSDTDAIFNFTFPKGEDGSAATIQVGTVQSGSVASVSNRGTTSNAIFDFTLPKGEKGDAGTSFKVLGMYDTYEALIEAHPQGNRGDAYAVGTSDDNVIYNWNNDTRMWDNLGGLKGVKGDQGDAATITIGTVVESNMVSVENVGTATNAILNFGLKQGEKGDRGDSATISVGSVTTGEITSVVNVGTNTNAIFDFVLQKGEKGDRGNPTVVNGKNGANITLAAKDLLMTDYEPPEEYTEIEETDTIAQAIGKLEMRKVKSGGAKIVIISLEEYIGKTITISKDEVEYTDVVPDTLENAFYVDDLGVWTIVVDDYTTTIEVTTYTLYKIEISAYGYKEWLEKAGITTSYESLEDVLANETDVRTLMTKHASADYFVEWYENDATMLDTFVANANAMKWIGLRDYLCDKLLAIEEVKTKLLESENWKYILKDSVPIMTSNTAPYGSASAKSVLSGRYAWYPFDESMSTQYSASTQNTTGEWVSYSFNNPVCVNRVYILSYGMTPNRYGIPTKLSVQGSNDGATWYNIKTFDVDVENLPTKIVEGNTYGYFESNFENETYYKMYRLYGDTAAYSGYFFCMNRLNFYGRALNVSVPIMTNNNAPYGECIAIANTSGYEMYKAFDKNDSTEWKGASGAASGHYIGYKFISPVIIKKVFMKVNTSAENTFVVEYSDDNVTWTATECEFTITSAAYVYKDVVEDKPHQYWRLYKKIGSTNSSNTKEIDFFGVDYSEKDNRKYLYDNGVEVETITKSGTSITASVDTTNYNLLRSNVGINVKAADKLVCGSANALVNNIPYNTFLDITSVNGTNTTGYSVINIDKTDDVSIWLE